MTDRSRFDTDVDEALDQWHDLIRQIATLERIVDTQDGYIADLLEDDTSNDQIIRLIAQERNDLRTELDATRDRLARALAGERKLREVRTYSWYGLAVLVAWKLTGRM